jgi:2-phosphosulfolactate phosphatase
MAATAQTLLEVTGNDAAIAAVSLYQQWQDHLLDLLHHASHGQRLLRLNNQADLAYCAQLDLLNVVPIQQSPGLLVK